MDAISTDRDDLNNFDRPPILIAASSDAARARAVRTIDASGLRIAGAVAVAEAGERLGRQVSVTAVWLELDEDCGGPLDELLTRVNRDVAEGRYAAVVSASSALVDPVMARLEDSTVEFIVDADRTSMRVATFAIATSSQGRPLRLSDVASDRNAERLRQLSDEVSRIAATLARLSTGPSSAPAPVEALQADLPPLSAETIRAVLRARRLRTRYFPEELFADPAWDMLLDLLQPCRQQRR